MIQMPTIHYNFWHFDIQICQLVCAACEINSQFLRSFVLCHVNHLYIEGFSQQTHMEMNVQTRKISQCAAFDIFNSRDAGDKFKKKQEK